MKEIPMSYIKANQAGIVLFAVLTFATRQPWLLGLLLAIQLAGLLLRWNLFVQAAKPFLRTDGETQAAELQRFNNVLAVLFLLLSVLSFSVGWTAAGYIFAGMLLAAAGTALLGYCIGCTVYFQYKQLLARRRLNRS
ncbi:DUF4395 family protein [Paenibacillus sp. HGH0039]|uniref:DUF4395 family protein n=1 Tax=Paenibacillus sp. HGH0039 TaxID=1078505 RepID=UPI00020D6DDC|nr:MULTISPECIES: DUF4395 family protein [Paenibacillus]EGL15926.1 hypothetical protein HMPREF9413_3537 [Paenibacillus sp. HGF7]EPD85369.1 hypothetical protein HMPREF1207_02999 [Paenibacillus sp. HGH0039]MBV6716222.1 DUF4395 domain-containing protein [Paenibacillus chitinolyticus]